MEKNRNDLDIRSLKYFIAAAEHLNFTSASKECFITQTAMSMHIAKMEEKLGFKLFVRGNRKAALTPAGAEFYRQARQIVRMYDDAVTYGSGIAEGTEGTVRVLVTSYMDALHYSGRFRAFRQACPAVSLEVRIVEPREIGPILRQRGSDLALCWPYDFELYEEYGTRIVDRAPVCVAVNSRHRLALQDELPRLADLERERVVVIGEGGLPNSYHTMRARVLELGFCAPSIVQVNKLEEILVRLETGDDIAILPRYIEELTAPGRLRFLPIRDGAPVTFDTAAVYNERHPGAALARLLEFFPGV